MFFLSQAADSSLFQKFISTIKQKYPQEYYILDLLDLGEFLQVLEKKLTKSSFCSSVFYNTVLQIEGIIYEVLSFHIPLGSKSCLIMHTYTSGLWVITRSHVAH